MNNTAAKPKKKVWKRPFFLINSGLVVLIIAFVLLRWYKVPVTIDSTFGSKPIALQKILKESFPGPFPTN